MTDHGYPVRSPLTSVRASIRPPREHQTKSNMAQRRALSIEDQSRLVSKTQKSKKVHYAMPPDKRALLYRVALQTGLRQSAIRRLRCCDVDSRESALHATGVARNKRASSKPIRPELLDDLLEHISERPLTAPLFDLPHQCSMARMIRLDCEAAGIDTTGVDFHAMRYSFATTLAASGVNPKVLADLLDDSLQTAMKYYTHRLVESEQKAIEQLPDLRDHVTNRATKRGKTA